MNDRALSCPVLEAGTRWATAPFCQAIVMSSIMPQMRCDFSPFKESDGAHPPHSGRGRKARRAPSARRPHDVASGDKRGVGALNAIYARGSILTTKYRFRIAVSFSAC